MDSASLGASTRIACVGDNCIDHYLPPIGHRFAAGNAVNVAVWLRRGGSAVDYFGAVGDDDDGCLILSALAAEGVGIDNVAVLSVSTSLTEIVVSPHGEREFVRVVEGAAEMYEPGREVVAALSAYRLVHGVNICDHTILTDPLLAAGVPVTYDFDTCARAGGRRWVDDCVLLPGGRDDARRHRRSRGRRRTPGGTGGHRHVRSQWQHRM